MYINYFELYKQYYKITKIIIKYILCVENVSHVRSLIIVGQYNEQNNTYITIKGIVAHVFLIRFRSISAVVNYIYFGISYSNCL